MLSLDADAGSSSKDPRHGRDPHHQLQSDAHSRQSVWLAAICFEEIRDDASKTDAEQVRDEAFQKLRLDGAVQDVCGGGL